MIRLLRHDDSVNREQDGAVKIEVLASIFPSRITSSSHWSLRTWLRFLQRGGEIKKRFLPSIRGHSGGTHIDPTLQHSVLLPDDFAEHNYHAGSSHDLHSIIQSGLVPGGKSVKKERHAAFIKAVNAMFVDQHKEVEYDLANARIAVYKNYWTIHQNIVYCAARNQFERFR